MTHRAKDPRYLARLQKFVALRWMIADGLQASERWFGALGRVERQLRIAKQFQQQQNTFSRQQRHVA